MKALDVPPAWCALFLTITWVQATRLPFPGGPAPGWVQLVGGLAVGGGLLLIILAAVELRRHRTPIHPDREAAALVTTGIFSRTRNPIYLGFLLILFGFILRWGAYPSVLLLPIFGYVLTDRFITPEEAALRRKFTIRWAEYERRTPRWLPKRTP